MATSNYSDEFRRDAVHHWHRFKKKLEAEGLLQPGLTLKRLRHVVATTLREAGLDERQIADLLGQKSPSMARNYSRFRQPRGPQPENDGNTGEGERAQIESCQTLQETVKP